MDSESIFNPDPSGTLPVLLVFDQAWRSSSHMDDSVPQDLSCLKSRFANTLTSVAEHRSGKGISRLLGPDQLKRGYLHADCMSFQFLDHDHWT